jgi:uncharacterized protein involved in outer membrane biogenesis
MRRSLFVLVPVLLVAIIVLVAVDRAPSFLRPRLEAAITRATGHTATIADVALGWSGGPTLAIRDLTVANAAWGSRADMLRVPAATVTLDVAALWRGVPRIASVRLRSPDLLVETDPSGRLNWARAATAPAPPAPGAPASADGPIVRIDTVTVAGGHLVYRDGARGRQFRADLDATAAAAADPVEITATVRAAWADLRLVARVARVAPLLRSSVSISGQVRLPEPVTLTASLTPGQDGLTVAARLDGAGLNASVDGVLDPRTLRPVGPVTLDATAVAGAPVAARFGVPTPASVHTRLRREERGVSLGDLRASLPGADIAGQLDVALTDPPSLHGSLSSPRVELARVWADMAPAAAASHAAAPAAVPPAAAAPGAAPARARPATPPFALLERANADLHLAVAELRDGAVVLRDVAGHAILRDGRLVIDPFTADGPGGPLTLTAHADARSSPRSIAVTLRAPALAVEPLLALSGLPGAITGTAAIDADLRATGMTPPEWLGSLDGQAGIRMADGDIDLRLLDDALAAARLPLRPHGRAHLRCLVVHADVASGVATLTPLLIDATNVVIQGTGTVSLSDHALALRLRPLLRTGPGVEIPVTVTGPWTRPRLDVDRGDLAGVARALTTPAGDPCRAAGLAVSAPPPSTKPLKPADLLRTLLR